MRTTSSAAARLTTTQAVETAGGIGDLSWRQAPAYAAEAAAQVGASVEFRALGRRASVFAAVRVRHLPGRIGGIAYVAGGPSGAGDPVELSEALDDLEAEYVRGRRLVLRIQPQFDPRAAESEAAEEVFQSRGFSPVEDAPYRTIVLDLAPGEAALRKALDPKWRSDLSRGERSDVAIVRSEKPADFERFAPLLRALAGRKGFTPPHDAGFFGRVAAAAVEPERIVLHLALHEDRVIAGHVGAYSGATAVYLLGAANDEGRERRAAYLLQWAAIRYALELGQRWYDTGGVDEVGNPDVYRFKKRMGGVLVERHAGWEKAPDPLRAGLVRTAETAYRALKRLRRDRP